MPLGLVLGIRCIKMHNDYCMSMNMTCAIPLHFHLSRALLIHVGIITVVLRGQREWSPSLLGSNGEMVWDVATGYLVPFTLLHALVHAALDVLFELQFVLGAQFAFLDKQRRLLETLVQKTHESGLKRSALHN